MAESRYPTARGLPGEIARVISGQANTGRHPGKVYGGASASRPPSASARRDQPALLEHAQHEAPRGPARRTVHAARGGSRRVVARARVADVEVIRCPFLAGFEWRVHGD